MLFKNRSTQYALLGVLCGAFAGCNDSNPPVTGRNTTNPSSTTVTADRPAPLDGRTTTSDPADRDNTGLNARDRDGIDKTPIDQNENKSDINITAAIRKQVVDTEMSVDAQNVKIITQNGRVTLRGPVETEQEKQRIDDMAKSVAGADKVDNQLEVTNK